MLPMSQINITHVLKTAGVDAFRCTLSSNCVGVAMSTSCMLQGGLAIAVQLHGQSELETDRISVSFSFSAPKLQVCQFRVSFVFGIFVLAKFRFRSSFVFGPLLFSGQSKTEKVFVSCKPSRIF